MMLALIAAVTVSGPLDARAAAPAASWPVALGESAAMPVADKRRLRDCDPRTDCPGRRPPGDPDRDARPFEGTLGRPCAYRWRFTPSGTRRVRVCF